MAVVGFLELIVEFGVDFYVDLGIVLVFERFAAGVVLFVVKFVGGFVVG